MVVHPILGVQDTEDDADRVLTELYRSMTPQQRANKLIAMWKAAQALAEADVRSRHPGIEDHEVRLRVASRRIPRELMIEAFGWDPVKHGY
jgi:hypothetical protein